MKKKVGQQVLNTAFFFGRSPAASLQPGQGRRFDLARKNWGKERTGAGTPGEERGRDRVVRQRKRRAGALFITLKTTKCGRRVDPEARTTAEGGEGTEVHLLVGHGHQQSNKDVALGRAFFFYFRLHTEAI